MTVNGTKLHPGDVQSVHRALDILETVGGAGDLGVTELSHQLGLPISTVHNLLRTITRRSFLLNSNGRYHLGPGVVALNAQWDASRSLSSLLRATLIGVSQRAEHAAYATVIVGHNSRVIGFEPAPGQVTAKSPDSTPTNPLTLATGRVLVAFTSDADWPEFIAAGQDPDPPRSSEQWRHELAAIQQSGLCVKYASSPRDSTVIAVPVWTRADTVICSIGSAVPASMATNAMLQATLDVLWAATTDLSAHLGCDNLPRPRPTIPAGLQHPYVHTT